MKGFRNAFAVALRFPKRSEGTDCHQPRESHWLYCFLAAYRKPSQSGCSSCHLWNEELVSFSVTSEIKSFYSKSGKDPKISWPFHSSRLLIVYFQGFWIQPNLSILRSYIVLVSLLDWGRDKVQVEVLQALLCCLCRLVQNGFVAKCHFCLKVPRG